MKLQRINAFDGIEIIPKHEEDKFLFNHCAGGERVMEKDEDRLCEMLFMHDVGLIEILNADSVEELISYQNKEVKR